MHQGPDLVNSRMPKLVALVSKLREASLVTGVRAAFWTERGALKDMLGNKNVAKAGFDLLQNDAEASHEVTLALLLVALGYPSSPTANGPNGPLEVDVSEIAAVIAARLVAKDSKNWTDMEEEEQTVVYYELLERTRSACTWLPRVLTSLAMADEQVRLMMYGLLEADDPRKIRQGALCIGYEMDDILRAIKRGLHVRWETNEAADTWHTALHDRLEKARTLAMQQFVWWRDRDHETATLFLRTLSKVVAGFGLLGENQRMMGLAQTMVTEWATQQKERRPCSAALAMAYMEVLETAARHLPVDDAPHHQALFIQGVSQCDTLWKAAVAMIQDPSNPLEQRIDAQEVVTAANLCISAVLRPASLWSGEPPAENPNSWVVSYMDGSWILADRLQKLVSLVPEGDTGGDWFFDLTPLHVSLRRKTMLVCAVSPTALGLLANMVMEEGVNVVAVMGLLVGASRFAAKADPEGREAVVQACIHVWGLGRAHGYIMACMGGLVRSEPSRCASEPMIHVSNSATNLYLRAECPDMPELFGACSLLKALAAACAGHMNEQLEEEWGKLVSELMCMVVRVSEGGAAKDEAFHRQEQRRALLESLLTCLPRHVTLPTVKTLLVEVTALLKMGVGEGVDEDDVRRCLAARLGVGTQLLQATKAHIQRDAEATQLVDALVTVMLDVNQARGLFRAGAYSDVMLRGGISFLHAALPSYPVDKRHHAFAKCLFEILAVHATAATRTDLVRCILHTLVGLLTPIPGMLVCYWPKELLILAINRFAEFSLSVKPDAHGLSTQGGGGLHFNWYLCGQDAKHLARAIARIANAQKPDLSSIQAAHSAEWMEIKKRQVGPACGPEEESGESDEVESTFLEEELQIDRGD